MISKLYWLVPKHVLYWKLAGQIPADEIVQMSQFIAQQIDTVTVHKVNMLLDATGLKEIDYNNKEARTAFSTLAKKESMGKVVALIRDYQLQFQMNALNSAFGLNWYNVSSMTDAIRALKNNNSYLQTIPTLLESSLIARPG